MKAVVIGGGVGGGSAALRLARAGWEVALVERGDALGGLVVSLEVGGTPIERYYHHIFPQEHEIIGLIDDMGLTPRLEWVRSSVAMLMGGKVWPFVSPLDLLRFGELPVIDRVHTGIGGLRSMRRRDWTALDDITAKEWLTSLTGRRGFDVVWEPLLRAKFGTAADDVPAAWMWGRFQQRAGARKRGVEKLGYLRGGFRQLFDALTMELAKEGVKLSLGTSVKAIDVGPAGVTGVMTDAGPIEADAVVYAGPLPGLAPLVPSPFRDPSWAAIGAMGAMAVVLELRRKITDTYWVNVVDRSLPMTAYIEHTNFVPRSDYNGTHIAYMARYFTPDDPIATADVEEESWRWIDAMADRGLPGFSRDDVVAMHPARTPYAAPLVRLGHLSRMPAVRAPIRGLYVATTAQIYPQDRGMSEGVRLGRVAASHVIADTGTTVDPTEAGGHCPVCGSTDRSTRYEVGEGTEGGVNADAFRPSSGSFGRAAASVVVCGRCGHGFLASFPSAGDVTSAYADAADPVSVREEAGQVATAARGLARVADLGCWTGSLLQAATDAGWDAVGVEPSVWASGRARERGLDVSTAEIADAGWEPGSFRAVAMCDVLEHLADPGAALVQVLQWLEPGGALYLTVPDAGSALARAMGRRWWSVLPMHLQYFTRESMTWLLDRHGFRVVSEATHTKIFTARYYAERLAGYQPAAAEALVGGLEKAGLADRPFAPDFRDRMEVIALAR